eukprot:scaffold62643_cov56-Phaeocystis_antarctica.AAC.1
MSALGFHHRSTGQRRSPLVMRGRLLELCCRARPRLPNDGLPEQHHGPHVDAWRMVRRRPHNPRRQRLEPLVVPPLRLGHLGAHVLSQRVKGRCRGLCPVSLCGLHVVPRVVERCTKVEVRRGPVGPQCDGLAVDPGCSAPVTLRAVLHALSHQLRVLAARLLGGAGLLLRGHASLLPPRPAILPLLPVLPHLLVKRPVQLPNAWVRRAVHAAEVRRRHLLVAAHLTDGVLLSLVVHV